LWPGWVRKSSASFHRITTPDPDGGDTGDVGGVAGVLGTFADVTGPDTVLEVTALPGLVVPVRRLVGVAVDVVDDPAAVGTETVGNTVVEDLAFWADEHAATTMTSNIDSAALRTTRPLIWSIYSMCPIWSIYAGRAVDVRELAGSSTVAAMSSSRWRSSHHEICSCLARRKKSWMS